MTYLDLFNYLSNIDKEKLKNMDLMVHDFSEDEYLPVVSITRTVFDDVLDDNHITINIRS
jgi:hypothetical protein